MLAKSTTELKMLGKNPLQNLFRELTSLEKVHTNIFDNRKISDDCNLKNITNNKVIVSCEHATNNFHQYSELISQSDKEFLETHWAYDPGAKDLALSLAKHTNSLAICSNFSRLILDPNRGLLSNTLIRKFVEVDYELDVNKNADRIDRLNQFYIPYYEILFEVMNFIKPEYFVSMHSFTPYYEKQSLRDFHVVLLYKNESNLTEAIKSSFDANNISYRINEPYNINDGELYAYDAMTNYDFPNYCKGILIEVRNDVAQNKEFAENLSKIIGDSVLKAIF